MNTPLVHGDLRPDLDARPLVQVPRPLTIDEAVEALRVAAAKKENRP